MATLPASVLNLLEVYYDDYRIHGKESADNVMDTIKVSQTQIVSEITQDIFSEAGRLKASYKISLADSFALAQAIVSKGIFLTTDHHEFDVIEGKEPIRFLWVR